VAACDRAIGMRDGRIVDAEPREAAWIGSSAR
jgi:hypothetical protein